MARPASRRDWKAYNHNLLTQEEVDEHEAGVRRVLRDEDDGRALPRGASTREPDARADQRPARQILASAQLAAREFFVDDRRAAPRRAHPASRGRSRARPAGRRAAAASARRGSASTPRRSTARSASAPADLVRLRRRGRRMSAAVRGPPRPRVRRRRRRPGRHALLRRSRRDRHPRRVARAPGLPPHADARGPTRRAASTASLHFAVLNANKLSVAINMSLPEGVAIARRLALAADVVAENFSPKAMAKWGLDWESLVRRTAGSRDDLARVSTARPGRSACTRASAARARRSPASTI